ncbi:hypothetical protein JYA63_09590 [Fictibacillus nanhaiensis]|uniref:Uncharacterized protein n=1 Tax=Fictibacillus nanhaiensis TaxID=742169 RepID=A0ABS2ZQ73_9BACL|nr:hypothetical protein [Fictibacillus nanhaiensis]
MPPIVNALEILTEKKIHPTMPTVPIHKLSIKLTKKWGSTIPVWDTVNLAYL